MVVRRTLGVVAALRFVIALVVGVIIGLIVDENARHIDRDGVALGELTVKDTTGTFNSVEFQEALDAVVFSREIRAFLYISPQLDEAEGGCEYAGLECVRSQIPTTFSTGHRPRSDALVIWVDPQLRTVTVDIGFLETDRFADMYEAEGFVSAALSHEFTDGQLDKQTIQDTIQILADVDSGFDYSRYNTTSWLAWLTGLVGFVITFILVTIIIQFSRNRQYAGSMTGVNRRERQRLIDDAREVFTRASHHIDSIELIGLGGNLGTYQTAMRQRIEMWREDYLDLSRTVMETAGLTDRELRSARHRRLVARLTHGARVVHAGINALTRDEQ